MPPPPDEQLLSQIDLNSQLEDELTRFQGGSLVAIDYQLGLVTWQYRKYLIERTPERRLQFVQSYNDLIVLIGQLKRLALTWDVR